MMECLEGENSWKSEAMKNNGSYHMDMIEDIVRQEGETAPSQ